jgi:hypothetical protein
MAIPPMRVRRYALNKSRFYEVLKTAKHSNPSKVWGDVKRYGEARYGAPESEGAG